MSAILSTKKALERRLASLLPLVPIAYEGVKFIPSDTEMYLRTQFQYQAPDDPVIGSNYYRERLAFQVFVVDVLGKGTATAISKAESIKALFTKGSTFQENGYNIYILKTPQIAGAAIASNRLIVPVLITVVTEVYT